jgi:hypothetical protein
LYRRQNGTSPRWLLGISGFYAGRDGGFSEMLVIVDLDEESRQLPKWDFSVCIGGCLYGVRELNVDDVERLFLLFDGGKLNDALSLIMGWLQPTPVKQQISYDALNLLVLNLGTYIELRNGATKELVLQKVNDARRPHNRLEDLQS